jgi:hypothetical protein
MMGGADKFHSSNSLQIRLPGNERLHRLKTGLKIILCLPLLSTMRIEAENSAIRFHSGLERTALLELYTSEGCSSCPPTEAWLSELQGSPRLWKGFVPVAFHVDYWDYLGWKDAWAEASFSERQRAYSQLWRAENVYTPELVLNGKEWHHWFVGKNGPATEVEPAGVLTVASADTNLWLVSFVSEQRTDTRYVIHAALLAGGIVSEVKAGENSGRRLDHDFVAVNLIQIGMATSNGAASGKFILNLAGHQTEPTLALAVWITRVDELNPLQATGGWLRAPVEK